MIHRLLGRIGSGIEIILSVLGLTLIAIVFLIDYACSAAMSAFRRRRRSKRP